MPKVLKWQDDDGVLLLLQSGRLAKALRQHGENAGGALLFLDSAAGYLRNYWPYSPGRMPVSSCIVFMMVRSASRTSAAEE